MPRLTVFLPSLLVLLLAVPALAEPIAVTATPVALHPDAPDRSALGALSYRGGLRIDSPDARFGGLSDLAVSADGRNLTAISDQGAVVELRLRYDDGWLSGAVDARVTALRGLDGTPLSGKRESDAEGFALVEGAYLVSFERDHRLWRYPSGLDGAAEPRSFPSAMKEAPANGGAEALAALADGRLVMLSEKLRQGDQSLGFLFDGEVWARLGYRTGEGFRPTGLGVLPGGDLLVLERFYTPITGPKARITRVAASDIVPGARLAGTRLAELARPLTVDNMEGLAVRRAGGETLIYLLSDDNFNPDQRTLLLLFALAD